MPKITLPQKKLTFNASSGANLMTFLQSQQIPVASSCLGEGICSKCHVQINGKVTPPSELEKSTLTRNHCQPEERLACQIVIEDTDLSVTAGYW